MLSTNIFGLIFTGMEHTLQLFITTLMSIFRWYQKWGASRFIVFAVILMLVLCSKYIKTLTKIPTAACNIQQQQLQMHRFANDYLKEPVAVNDLGYVSYQNENYVLDLWGLASLDALRVRLENAGDNASWMEQMTLKHNVKLVMIYDHWFELLPIPGSNWGN